MNVVLWEQIGREDSELVNYICIDQIELESYNFPSVCYFISKQ